MLNRVAQSALRGKRVPRTILMPLVLGPAGNLQTLFPATQPGDHGQAMSIPALTPDDVKYFPSSTQRAFAIQFTFGA